MTAQTASPASARRLDKAASSDASACGRYWRRKPPSERRLWSLGDFSGLENPCQFCFRPGEVSLDRIEQLLGIAAGFAHDPLEKVAIPLDNGQRLDTRAVIGMQGFGALDQSLEL